MAGTTRRRRRFANLVYFGISLPLNLTIVHFWLRNQLGPLWALMVLIVMVSLVLLLLIDRVAEQG